MEPAMQPQTNASGIDMQGIWKGYKIQRLGDLSVIIN
jgi:hypothetical protein